MYTLFYLIDKIKSNNYNDFKYDMFNKNICLEIFLARNALMYCCEYNNLYAIIHLINYYKINKEDILYNHYGYNCIQLCIANNNKNILKYIIKKFNVIKTDLEISEYMYNRTTKIIKYVIKYLKIDINDTDIVLLYGMNNYENLIHYILKYNKMSKIKLLNSLIQQNVITCCSYKMFKHLIIKYKLYKLFKIYNSFEYIFLNKKSKKLNLDKIIINKYKYIKLFKLIYT